ncbi:MAG: DUF6029 family protein [Saprospiraceae bacterium]
MRSLINSILTAFLFLISKNVSSQDELDHTGVFNAYLTTQAGIFIRDSSIGASGTPQYDHQLFGSETWLDTRYSNWGFDFGLRFDLYNNSNLINPQASFNKQGIGRWFIKKDFSTLGFEAGYIYDQIGSGVIYRAYEQRNLGIDNALYGLKLNYQWNADWHIKAFAGKQKKQFDLYESVIKGISIDGYIQSKDSMSWSWAPGVGMIGRTLDDESMTNLLSAISTYQKEDQFLPKYNSYAFSLYNQIRIKNVGLFLETALKSRDVLNDPNGERKSSTGTIIRGPKFINTLGHVFYGSLNYSKPRWGFSLEGKHTKYFGLRTRPQESGNNGLIHFIPPMARQNSYRLLSFYPPATQDLSELALQGELRISLKSDWDLTLHQSTINTLDHQKLYREYLIESSSRKDDQYTLITGIQWREYNQEVYEGKPKALLVKTITPYIDFSKQLDEVRSWRLDIEYMFSKQDQGSWANVLIEYSIAPLWVFSISDMYNIKPVSGDKHNYYTAGFVYNKEATRVGFSFVRQRSGIVCSGGICRYEPAFNGIKFSLESRL